MKAVYRGCDIEATRDRALGGWSEVYWSAFRKSDGYGINSGFGGGSVREMFTQMKRDVDFFKDQCGGRVDRHQKQFAQF